MKELRGTEWYGEYATLTDEHNDYIQIEYKCMEQAVYMTTPFSLVLT